MRNVFIFFFLIFTGCTLPVEVPDQPGPVVKRDALRVVDINVWSGLDYRGYVAMGAYESAAVREKRYQALVVQLKELGPDIIGVHEANKLPDYIRRLAGDLGYDAVFHVGIGGLRAGPVGLPWNLREGDAILAKKVLGLTAVGRRQLSGGYVGAFFTCHFEDATQVVAARILLNGKPVFLFATHWHASVLDTPDMQGRARELAQSDADFEAAMAVVEAGKQWRLDEMKKAVTFIEEIAGDESVILMGDFNATEETVEVKGLLDSGLVDTFRQANPAKPGATWGGRANLNITKFYLASGLPPAVDLYEKLNLAQEGVPKRIDYIFAGPPAALRAEGISIAASRVVLNRVVAGVHASDHFGVMTDFQIIP